jgi:hypothetical protein
MNRAHLADKICNAIGADALMLVAVGKDWAQPVDADAAHDDQAALLAADESVRFEPALNGDEARRIVRDLLEDYEGD